MINHVIKHSIKTAIKNLYKIDISIEQIPLEHPNNNEWGDFASSIALKLASELKQSPIEIAKSLSYELNNVEHTFEYSDQTYPIFKKINYAAPGFVNFLLSDSWLQHVLYVINAEGFDYGSQDIFANERIALEHSNVNPNKATHIGHLRNACIGQFIERAYEKLGADVEVQYLNNDLGVQVTTSLMGTKYIKELSAEDYDKFDHYAWDVYARMENLIDKNEDLKKEREQIMQKLENSKEAVSIEQEQLSSKILIEQLKTFQQLGFDYDVVVRERDIINLGIWEEAFELLKKNENVYFAESGPSKGCWLVKMPHKSQYSENIEEDKIIVRSNGVPTYTGKDIAYHMWKFGILSKDFYYTKLNVGTQTKPLWVTSSDNSNSSNDVSFSGVNKVINVVDVKQTYALESVKNSLRYLNYESAADNMFHVNYGFVYLSPETAKKLGIDISDGKSQYGMSGRKGWGIKTDDFITMIDNKIISEHGDFGTRKMVRNGAIKFEMLKHNTFQDLIFDIENAMNLQGFTGPYVQYTHARIVSVLSKAGFIFNNQNYSYVLNEMKNSLNAKELEILRYIYQYPEILEKAALEFTPNTLCAYLFELAQRYNSFYNELPIINAESNDVVEFRLNLSQAVQIVLKDGLYLLGIDAPDKM